MLEVSLSSLVTNAPDSDKSSDTAALLSTEKLASHVSSTSDVKNTHIQTDNSTDHPSNTTEDAQASLSVPTIEDSKAPNAVNTPSVTETQNTQSPNLITASLPGPSLADAAYPHSTHPHRPVCIWQDVPVTRAQQKYLMKLLERIQTALFVIAHSVSVSMDLEVLQKITAMGVFALCDAVVRVFAADACNPVSAALEGGLSRIHRVPLSSIFACSLSLADNVTMDMVLSNIPVSDPYLNVMKTKTIEYLRERLLRAEKVLFEPSVIENTFRLTYQDAELELMRAIARTGG